MDDMLFLFSLGSDMGFYCNYTPRKLCLWVGILCVFFVFFLFSSDSDIHSTDT